MSTGYEKKNNSEDFRLMMNEPEEEMSDEMKRWTAWSQSRNVVDRYKNLTNEDIQKDLKENSLPYAVAFENLLGDFNLASSIRNANAFGARDFYYLGRRRIDRRGAVGCHIYTPPTHLKSLDELRALKSQYKFVSIDNLPGSISIYDYKWEPNTMIVFGEEGRGISEELQKECDEMVYIPQYGSIRSINVATASGIVMNSICTQFKNGK